MSVLLGPYDIGIRPSSADLTSRKISRRRTVSTGFEQTRQWSLKEFKPKSKSYAYDMEGLSKSDLKKKAMLNNYLIKQSDSLLDGDTNLNEDKDHKGFWDRIPGAGIILILFCVIIYQSGNVAAKKMAAPPFMMIFLRDVGSLFMMTPVNIAIAAPVYQRGSIAMNLFNILRSCLVASLLCGYFYAIRYLPLSDVMMISSIRPAITTFLSWLVLKEAFGIVEIVNLLLTISGIVLVVQPPFLFGTGNTQYTPHMTWTALGLLGVNILAGGTTVIIRHMKRVHWATQALGSRFIICLFMLTASAVTDQLCLPECGYDRWGITALALVATISQCLTIKAIQIEEAHIVSLVENAGSIVISLLLQIIIFGDIPNTVKILGAILTITSIFIIGIQKIFQARAKMRTPGMTSKINERKLSKNRVNSSEEQI